MFLGECLMVAAWQLAVEQCEFSAKYLVMKILIVWLNWMWLEEICL